MLTNLDYIPLLGVAGFAHFAPTKVTSRARTFSGMGAGWETSTYAKRMGFSWDLCGRICRFVTFVGYFGI